MGLLGYLITSRLTSTKPKLDNNKLTSLPMQQKSRYSLTKATIEANVVMAKATEA